MEARDFLNKIRSGYESTFDLEEKVKVGEMIYDLYGYHSSHLEKYVLERKAQMWQIDHYEHVFFTCGTTLSAEEIQKSLLTLKTTGEAELVRKNEKYPPKDHMYSYLTLNLIVDTLDKAAIKAIKTCHFRKHYLFDIRGFCELRVIAVTLSDGKLYTNGAGKDIKKFYRKQILKIQQESNSEATSV